MLGFYFLSSEFNKKLILFLYFVKLNLFWLKNLVQLSECSVIDNHFVFSGKLNTINQEWLLIFFILQMTILTKIFTIICLIKVIIFNKFLSKFSKNDFEFFSFRTIIIIINLLWIFFYFLQKISLTPLLGYFKLLLERIYYIFFWFHKNFNY